MPEYTKFQHIEGTVLSTSGGWHSIVRNNGNPKYPEKLRVTPETADLSEGDVFSLFVKTTVKGSFQRRTMHISVPEDACEKEQGEVWMGFIRDTYTNKGYLYKKGVERLMELGVMPYYEDEIQQMRQEIDARRRQETIDRYIGYIREAYKDGRGKIYENGVLKLHELGYHGMDPEIEDMKAGLGSCARSVETGSICNIVAFAIPCPTTEEAKKFPPELYYTLRRPLPGETYYNEGRALQVISSKKGQPEEETEIESQWWWVCKAVDVSDTEEGQYLIQQGKARESMLKAKEK